MLAYATFVGAEEDAEAEEDDAPVLTDTALHDVRHFQSVGQTEHGEGNGDGDDEPHLAVAAKEARAVVVEEFVDGHEEDT